MNFAGDEAMAEGGDPADGAVTATAAASLARRVPVALAVRSAWWCEFARDH